MNIEYNKDLEEWFVDFGNDLKIPAEMYNGELRINPDELKYYYENKLDEFQRDDFENFIDRGNLKIIEI